MNAALYIVVVGAVLVRERQARDLTQAHIAERLGVVQNTVSRMERGQLSITIERFACWARVFGLQPRELAERVDAACVRLQALGVAVHLDMEDAPLAHRSYGTTATIAALLKLEGVPPKEKAPN